MLSRLSKRDPHMAGTLNNLGELTADIKVAGVCEETNVARFMENAKKLDEKVIHKCHYPHEI